MTQWGVIYSSYTMQSTDGFKSRAAVKAFHHSY